MATDSGVQQGRVGGGGARSIPLWVTGDWNAFFGLFTNVILNVLVLTGLVLGVVKLPNDIVFGRILPALGIALPLGNLWYAYLAYRMAQREGRTDVAAMPYGPRVAGGSGVVLHHWRDLPDRRVRRADHSQVHASGSDARHARWHLDRVYLAAAGLPELGRAVDRLRITDPGAGGLDGRHSPARQHSRGPGGGDRGDGAGLGHGGDESARGRRVAGHGWDSPTAAIG